MDLVLCQFLEILHLEGNLLLWICGDVIYHKTPQDLKEFLNIPILINFTYNWQNYHPNILGTLDWNVLYKRMMENKSRSQLIMNIIDLLNSLGYNTISYVSRKQQGLNILSNYTTEQTCCWYSGEFHIVENNSIVRKTDKIYNQQNLRDEFGKTKQSIIGTQHLIEGLDFSAPLNALVLTEMKSDRQSLQKIGRIVRMGPKKSIIINFIDTNVKILRSQAQQRAATAKEEFGCSEVTLDSLDKLKLLLNT
jgi:superfamily II DNA or RNA helicase